MLADFSEFLWSRQMPHGDIWRLAFYHLPGAMLVGLGALALRMTIEEVLKHLSEGLARAKAWTVLCALLWLVIMRSTNISDDFAKKIHWDQLVSPPQSRAPATAPAQQPRPGARR